MSLERILLACLVFVGIAKSVHSAIEGEVFIKLNGAFKWEPLLVTHSVKHKALCLSHCLFHSDCVAVYVTSNADTKYGWSCDLLGKLVIGSIQRLESGKTWINQSESRICPPEFNYIVNGNCYYLESQQSLSWDNSKQNARPYTGIRIW